MARTNEGAVSVAKLHASDWGDSSCPSAMVPSEMSNSLRA